MRHNTGDNPPNDMRLGLPLTTVGRVSPAPVIAALCACLFLACSGARPDLPGDSAPGDSIPADPASGDPASGSGFEIVTTAGQSNNGNTNGVADPTGIADVTGVRLLPFYNSGSFSTSISPLPNVGVHPFIAAALRDAGHGTTIIRHFDNGTEIALWQSGQALANQLRIARASAILKLDAELAEVISPRHSFVWIQGESDATDPRLAASYEDELRTFLDTLDAEWNNPLTLVVGINSGFARCQHRATVRAAQVAVAAEKPHRRFVNTDDITGHDRAFHYTTPGFAQLGARIAATILAP
jgi:hypothetical protein